MTKEEKIRTLELITNRNYNNVEDLKAVLQGFETITAVSSNMLEDFPTDTKEQQILRTQLEQIYKISRLSNRAVSGIISDSVTSNTDILLILNDVKR